MVSEKKIFLIFPIISLWELLNDPRGMASLDPMGVIDRIYVGDH